MAEKPSAKVSRLEDARPAKSEKVPRVEVMGLLRPHWLGEALECRKPGRDENYYVVAIDPSIDVDERLVTERIRTLPKAKIEGLPTQPELVRLADRRLGLSYPYQGTATLNEALSGSALPVERALSIVRQTASLIHKLHDKKGVHGALTLDGVILNAGDSKIDTVSVVDFGLRYLFPDSKQLAPAANPACIPVSPERAVGLEYDAAEDVYALGCLAFALLTGELPLVGREPGETLRRHAIEDAPKLAEFDSSIDNVKLIGPVIDKALSKEPGDRHKDARSFDQALARALRDASIASVSGVHKALPETLKGDEKTSPAKKPAKLPGGPILPGAPKTKTKAESKKPPAKSPGQADHERLLAAVGASAKDLPPPVLPPAPGSAAERIGKITATFPALKPDDLFDESSTSGTFAQVQTEAGGDTVVKGPPAKAAKPAPAGSKAETKAKTKTKSQSKTAKAYAKQKTERKKKRSKDGKTDKQRVEEKLEAIKAAGGSKAYDEKRKSEASAAAEAAALAREPQTTPPEKPAPLNPQLPSTDPVVASPLAMATAAAAKPKVAKVKPATAPVAAPEPTTADPEARSAPITHPPVAVPQPVPIYKNPLMWAIPAAFVFGSLMMLVILQRDQNAAVAAASPPSPAPATAAAVAPKPKPEPEPEPESEPKPVAEPEGETGSSAIDDDGLVMDEAAAEPFGEPPVEAAPTPLADPSPTPAPETAKPAVDPKKLAADGTKAYKAGNTSTALKLWKEALEGDKKNLDALKGLANIYFDKGNYSRAAYYGRKAVAARPRDANLRISLGDYYYKAGKTADAKKQYLKAKDLGSKRAASRLKKVGG